MTADIDILQGEPPIDGQRDLPDGRGMRMLIAGGGTGGHLFPGIAVARRFVADNPENRVLFVVTGKPFEEAMLGRAALPFRRIRAEGLKGRGRWRQVRALVKVPGSVWQSLRIMRQFRPEVVLGLGSYTAGAVAAAAWLLRIPLVLHEQNLLPGITTRMLARLADRILISFAETAAALGSPNCRVTGNPVREEILQAAGAPSVPYLAAHGRSPFTVLIVGGSQGAHSINMALIEALGHLHRGERFFFVHQTGAADEAAVEAAYRLRGVAGKVQAFFDDMDRRYRQADLVICRSGATTVAELTALGKGAVLIPYPFAADDHQVANARPLAKAEAAEMILESELSGEHLARRIDFFADHPEALARMADRARRFGRPAAAAAVVAQCRQVVLGRQ
jgi:UDP-N-acetylglucosamine--N-acetylmuramyl-(pentapeptide) pyrophosphoryl-undecaprenol N-acetylglucosamine transferase